MDLLKVEETVLGGVLGSNENLLFALSRTAKNFAAYITSKELKFILVAAVECFEKYSGLMTEQFLVDALIVKGAEEEAILKYKYLYKQLKRNVPSEQDFKIAVEKLTDSFISRCMIDSMMQANELLQRDKNGLVAFDVLEKNMMILRNQISQQDMSELSTKEITGEVVLYDDMKAHPEKYLGIKIGIKKLDEMTGGFRPGELVVAMGATKVGKSIFLLHCQYSTMLQGKNSVLFSIEMSKEQCRRRLVSRITELPYLKIKNVHLTPEEELHMKTLLEKQEQSTGGQSIIVDVPKDCTAKVIEAKTRALMRTQRVDLIIVDYLLLMTPNNSMRGHSREEGMTEVAKELKQLARTLGIPVISATQVAAEAAKTRNKTTDKVYDWVDGSQAKSIAAHCDWLLSLKREPEVNMLNLGVSVGRDGAIDEVIALVCDYSKMAIHDHADSTVSTAQAQTEETRTEDVKTSGHPF